MAWDPTQAPGQRLLGARRLTYTAERRQGELWGVNHLSDSVSVVDRPDTSLERKH